MSYLCTLVALQHGNATALVPTIIQEYFHCEQVSYSGKKQEIYDEVEDIIVYS